MKISMTQIRPVKGNIEQSTTSIIMNLFICIIMLSVFLLTSCNTAKNNTEMKNISLIFSGIEFTKAINGAENHYRVNDSLLVVDGIGGSNYFISPDGMRTEATAPILLKEIDNSRPFTFTTCVESKIEKIYDAGTIYIYIDNEHWLKFAFERDEKLRCRVVTVKTDGSSDDNNHDIIGQDYVYMRIASNGKQIGYYYSTNGVDWNLARIYKNNYPQKIWLGLSSQSPKPGNNPAFFGKMSLTDSYISNHRLGE
jgi:regulation of enolase protein 1 (concanavalin A-like superfamily)